MKVDEAKSAELVARLETLPFSKWHRDFFILGFIGVMFDAADFALFGAALPPIAREFGLGPAQSGLLATVGLVGAFVGALFWGTVSDYIGRRTSFSATIGIFSVFTALVAASWNVASLAVFRFMSNFGLGGEVPVTATLGADVQNIFNHRLFSPNADDGGGGGSFANLGDFSVGVDPATFKPYIPADQVNLNDQFGVLANTYTQEGVDSRRTIRLRLRITF